MYFVGQAWIILKAETHALIFGQTAAGRYLKVVYVPDKVTDSVFVVTAYELRGNALRAYRRAQRRKKR